jgi:hypothetical protein
MYSNVHHGRANMESLNFGKILVILLTVQPPIVVARPGKCAESMKTMTCGLFPRLQQHQQRGRSSVELVKIFSENIKYPSGMLLL